MDGRVSIRAVLVVTLLVLAPVSVVAGQGTVTAAAIDARPSSADPGVCAGTITSPANGTTVVSIQGSRGLTKKPARQVAFGPNGDIQWTHDESAVWSYDVDPMRNGHLFVTAAKFGKTTLYVLDPVTGERIWERTFNMTDTHDADLVNGGEEILIANMRNYDAATETNEDRILLYNRTRDEVVWEWEFDDHYNRSVGGEYDDDWSHVNDVDKVGEGRYLVSPRNFDQVIVVNRSSGDIDLRLGENRNHRILRQQHNPDYLETNRGRPTMLVADSENDRIVEYTRADGEWNRTWSLGNRSTLNWPRDADRLPNGNTLVTDSRNHRVFEVTPGGEIVWEVYTPWLPYDAERVRYGGSSRGPTIADLGSDGDPPLRASAGGHRDASTLERCAAAIGNETRGNVSLTVVPYTRPEPSPTATASPPQGGSNASGPGFGSLAALAALAVWIVYVRRERD